LKNATTISHPQQSHADKSLTRFLSYRFASKDNLVLCVDEDSGLIHDDKSTGETFLKIRKAGALSIAYAQLFSMGNVSVLEHLEKLQTRQARKTVQNTAQPDLNDLFDEEDGTIIG
jgi:hypothetical protein